MIPKYRKQFEENYSEGKYRKVLSRMEQGAGDKIPFRIAESPIFLPQELASEMLQASREIVTQISENPDFVHAGKRIPPGSLVPNEDHHPLFLLFDYALARSSTGKVRPQITEIQGFASLM